MGKMFHVAKSPRGGSFVFMEHKKKIKVIHLHRWVWMMEHGPILPGFEIHHVDEDPSNNDLSNLQILTRSAHRRIHNGWEKRGDVWWKPCKSCETFFPATTGFFYKDRGAFFSKCHPCHREWRKRRAKHQ